MRIRRYVFSFLAGLAIAFLGLMSPSVAHAQEAGYTIHVDLHTKAVSRAAIVPVGSAAGVPFFGVLEISALVAIETNVGLGVGIGKSGPLGENLRWNAGLSYLDSGGSWNPRLGGYAGVSWKLTSINQTAHSIAIGDSPGRAVHRINCQ